MRERFKSGYMYRNRLTRLTLSIKQRTRITPTGLSPLEEVFGLALITLAAISLEVIYMFSDTTPATTRVHEYLRDTRGSREHRREAARSTP